VHDDMPEVDEMLLAFKDARRAADAVGGVTR
jgi:hypothetical protein